MVVQAMRTALLLAMLWLAACNTIAGFGRDISTGAERVGTLF